VKVGCCTVPAPHKRHGHQGAGRDIVICEPLEDRLSRRGIGHDLNATVAQGTGLRRELRLASKETFYKALRQIVGLEIVK
jgi:hypothetical protein